MTDVLLQEDTDGVRVLTLNRPKARNALSTELAAALHAATAERIGVVPHDQLMPRVMDCARATAEVPADTARGLKEMYVSQAAVGPVLAAELEGAARRVPDWAGLEKRRLDVMTRNRAQIGEGGREGGG